jgi:ryanodine receptor 2
MDRVVISSKSFPMKYWDKFVRRKTKQKYRDQVDEETLEKLLGAERSPGDTSFDYRLVVALVHFSQNLFIYKSSSGTRFGCGRV